MNLPAQIQEKLSQRQTQAIIVGILILAIIAVLQVVNANNSQQLVALLESQQQLCEGDLERMEFAIGKSGISGCRIDNGILMVPEHCKEDCLNAIANLDVLPQFLRENAEDEPSINPFLSRSQQKQVADARKKKLVREMVVRLPFVNNAWFEMDRSSGGTAFRAAKQTAVVSVEPPVDTVLDAVQVATLREMIAGAIAGLPAENIRVIDITSGLAYRPAGMKQTVVSIEQRPAVEQEVIYRKRIQEAIKAYGDIDVQVRVDKVVVAAQAQQVAFVQPIAKTPPSPRTSVAVIGTNGAASIYDVEKEQPAPKLIAPVAVEPTWSSRVEVMLQVPESAAAQMSIGRPDFPADKPNIKQQAVNQLGRRLMDTVKPILPDDSFKKGDAFPITVQFLPTPAAPKETAPTWQDGVRSLVAKHWPSFAVLLVGLVLLTLMTRQSSYETYDHDNDNEDIISINASAEESVTQVADQTLPEVALAQPEDYAARREAEQKLGSMVEKDPESAARVIESWIRNAG